MKNRGVLKLEAHILDGQIQYRDPQFRERIKEFKDLNDGFDCDIIFESHSRPEHWQYKYLYGFVYPAISQGMGEGSIDTVDEIMKEKFLFQEVADRKDIPVRHRSRSREFYVDYKDGEETKRQIYGYIPSKTTLNFKEMKFYIEQCETVMNGLEDWHISTDKIAEMQKCRELAMNQIKGEIVECDENVNWNMEDF